VCKKLPDPEPPSTKAALSTASDGAATGGATLHKLLGSRG
jgi:hypothetical protein